MKTTHAILITALMVGAPEQPRRDLVDLTRIGPLRAKGRIQDEHQPVVDTLITAGVSAVPFLVSKLEDRTRIPGREPVLAFWPRVEVRHVALLVLCDLFTRADGSTSTVAGLDWDEVLERRDRGAAAWELYDGFVSKHGRAGIRLKVEQLLAPYKDRIVWDAAERCFRPES